jgi:hypothetical protein
MSKKSTTQTLYSIPWFYSLSIAIGSIVGTVHAMNLLVPYNPLIRPYASSDECVQFFSYIEGGIGHAIGFDEHTKVNVLRIYNARQNSLAMLEGFPSSSPQSALFANINPLRAGSDGLRGMFDVCGNLALDVGGGIAMRYFIGHGWSVNAYLPFYSMQLKNITWNDLTQTLNAEDERTRMLLTEDHAHFAQNVYVLGEKLNIETWHRAGLGDLAILLDWHRDFPQTKPVLRNVAINARAGFSAPTGLRTGLHHIMALPFGADGAWSLPFALGIELTFGTCILLGLDVQLIHIFGNTHTERVLTMPTQTSLLFLQEACVFRDWGWNQQFSLWLGFKDIPEGLSASLGYQYVKQGRATLSPVSSDISTVLINMSPTVEDWTVHQIIARTDYDFRHIMPQNAVVTPRLAVFAQIPFNGKRSILFTTVGFSCAIDF